MDSRQLIEVFGSIQHHIVTITVWQYSVWQ